MSFERELTSKANLATRFRDDNDGVCPHLPQTFVLPDEREAFDAVAGDERIWILKGDRMNRGEGICLFYGGGPWLPSWTDLVPFRFDHLCSLHVSRDPPRVSPFSSFLSPP